LNELLGSNALNSYVYDYFLKNRSHIEQYKTADEFISALSSQELFQGFASQASDSLHVDSLSEEDKKYIGLRLKALLARYKWRNSGFFEVMNVDDTAIRKAMSK
jgi:carboxyl-terminal processing protease